MALEVYRASAAPPVSDDCINGSLVSGKLEFGGSTYFDGEYVEKEKQISVDPISLRESSAREDSDVPVVSAPPDVADLHLPPPLPPTQFKFLSYSLPNSVNSSPRFGAGVASMKMKGKIENPQSRLKVCNSTKHQLTVQEQLNVHEEETHFRRSKSCGEGRASAPADDLDLWLNQPNFVETKNHGGLARTESNKDHRESARKSEPSDDGFRCGALCLFLPGFSRGKAVRSIRKEEPEVEHVISRTVSLEKFECGSWASSTLANDIGEDGDSNSTSLFFDLPLELIKNSGDTNAPVNAAFVFDKDRKGVLKNSSTKSNGKSHEPSHHVRFSTSSPSGPSSPVSCITPRLRKAREEFNAFLEAQSSA